MRGSHSCLGFAGVARSQSSIQLRDCGDNRLRLLERDRQRFHAMLVYVAGTSPQDPDHLATSGRFADRASPMS